MEDQKEYYRQIIKTIYQLLESKGYTQVSVVKKLFSLAIKLSTTTFKLPLNRKHLNPQGNYENILILFTPKIKLKQVHLFNTKGEP